MIALASNTSALLRMVYSSLLASIAVAVVFSLVIYGAIRSSELRRVHRGSRGAALAAVSVAGFVAFMAIIGYGLYLVAHKG
jgi:asparagine N-glycosylation enzyme membrane subunit Stt3